MRILLIALIAAGIFMFLRWQYRQSPRRLYQWLAILVGVGLVLLVLAGRAHWIVGVFGGMLPFLGKAMGLMRLLSATGWIRRAFGSSAIRMKTAWLDVSVDRATGEMDGVVLRGEFSGKRLSQLNFQQLERVMQECAGDPQSVSLLHSYLQRNHADWRGSGERTDEFEDSVMSVKTAAQILGVSAKASESEIRSAHRNLAQKLHPDRNGNDYLTRKINQARDILLKKR